MVEPVSDAELVAALRDAVTGEVRAGEPMAGHTTLRVGGPAAAWVRAETPDDLRTVADVGATTARPWLILGRGSNLLVADRGWPGVAVTLGSGFRGVERDGDGLVTGGAEPMPALAVRAERERLSGLAFGVAIPGTVGGAVRMNAGAHGGQIADVLDWVEVVRLARGGAVERLEAASLELAYRRSALPEDAVAVRARMALVPADADTLSADMSDMRRWRRAHQPLSEPSCGSVFSNPAGDSAGRLIDDAGLKGYRVGGARISERHANFIVTERGATADDVHRVLREAQRRVADAGGVRLRPEVVIVGFAGDEVGADDDPAEVDARPEARWG